MVHRPVPRSSVMPYWPGIRRFGSEESHGRGQDSNGPVLHEILLLPERGALITMPQRSVQFSCLRIFGDAEAYSMQLIP